MRETHFQAQWHLQVAAYSRQRGNEAAGNTLCHRPGQGGTAAEED